MSYTSFFRNRCECFGLDSLLCRLSCLQTRSNRQLAVSLSSSRSISLYLDQLCGEPMAMQLQAKHKEPPQAAEASRRNTEDMETGGCEIATFKGIQMKLLMSSYTCLFTDFQEMARSS
ncbi:hypothetical protein V6N11_046504 [Hibiscus sabdariffa]|uniref:Uncharacterized protein n=2 Tax=Hibiscus sabdariffa TaxID=183260 RepID=A0ABR2BVP9_9ROSI